MGTRANAKLDASRKTVTADLPSVVDKAVLLDYDYNSGKRIFKCLDSVYLGRFCVCGRIIGPLIRKTLVDLTRRTHFLLYTDRNP
jgi:hypothetical protein